MPKWLWRWTSQESPASPSTDTVSKLAYEEALRIVKAQEGVLDNLRARAGTVIAVASLVTSFLGGQALVRPTLSEGVVIRQELGCWGIAAIGLFVLATAFAIAIIWPYKWRFDLSPVTILDEWPQDDYEGALRDLARYHSNNHDYNGKLLRRLFWFLQLSCLLLVAETLAWIIDLAW
jgi:hypothetical protein